MYHKDNKGLIATQNRDQRMAFENALKSYSATINGCGGNKEFLKLVLGEKEYNLLTKIGLTQFCYQKTKELYERFPFPDDTSDFLKEKMAQDHLAEQGEEIAYREAEARRQQEWDTPILPPDE